VAGVPEEDGLRKRELLETLDKTVEELLFLGVSWGELVERIRKKSI
jgi:hypothetical protein